MEFPNSELWNYATQIWSLPEVESNCLNLQDDFSVDINILMFCLWAGGEKYCFNEDDLQVLLDTVKPWQTMINPLRDARKMMQHQMIAMPSGMVDQTIGNMKEMELNAEHMALLALEKALSIEAIKQEKDASEIECSLKNINLYFQSQEETANMSEANAKVAELLNNIYQDEEAIQVALMTVSAEAQA